MYAGIGMPHMTTILSAIHSTRLYINEDTIQPHIYVLPNVLLSFWCAFFLFFLHAYRLNAVNFVVAIYNIFFLSIMPTINIFWLDDYILKLSPEASERNGFSPQCST